MVHGWLLLAAGDDRQHGGNDGYDDEPDVHYSWDDTVNNSGRVAVGDPIAIWDKKTLLGASIVETIEHGEADKILRSCPKCGMANLKPRKTMVPLYRCGRCKAEFDDPSTRVVHVRTFRSRHDAGWTDLGDVLDGGELRDLQVTPGDQLSLRRLRWDDFVAAVEARTGASTPSGLTNRLPPANGHVRVTVRVRLGQRRFRQALLKAQGEVCALTGPAPRDVLEAGHLYSYGLVGVHHLHGGLMLRRDVHRLFDGGAVAIDPTTQLIDVAAEIRSFPQYGLLHGAPLHLTLASGQIAWIERHWRQHRPWS